jgi:phosphate transport system protein
LSEEPVDPIILMDLQRMAKLGLDMLRRALDAFVVMNVDTARSIPDEDEAVDQLYNRIYRMLVDQMKADTTTVDRANHMMWAAHNLERMADRVTNICERIVYVCTGEMKELEKAEGLEEIGQG